MDAVTPDPDDRLGELMERERKRSDETLSQWLESFRGRCEEANRQKMERQRLEEKFRLVFYAGVVVGVAFEFLFLAVIWRIYG